MAIHRVWLATEMGDPIDALRQAAHVDDTALPPALAERRASHLITVAWSHYLPRPAPPEELPTGYAHGTQSNPSHLSTHSHTAHH